MSLNTFSSVLCDTAWILICGSIYILTTGQTLDPMFVPNNLYVRTTAGETSMMFGHKFPPHIASLAGYNYYIVNVWHSSVVILI